MRLLGELLSSRWRNVAELQSKFLSLSHYDPRIQGVNMNRHLAPFIVVVALLGAAFWSLAAPSGSDSGPPFSNVREQWQKAWNEKNLPELVGLYAEDAVLLTKDKQITGRENIENYLKEAMKESS